MTPAPYCDTCPVSAFDMDATERDTERVKRIKPGYLAKLRLAASSGDDFAEGLLEDTLVAFDRLTLELGGIVYRHGENSEAARQLFALEMVQGPLVEEHRAMTAAQEVTTTELASAPAPALAI